MQSRSRRNIFSAEGNPLLVVYLLVATGVLALVAAVGVSVDEGWAGVPVEVRLPAPTMLTVVVAVAVDRLEILLATLELS